MRLLSYLTRGTPGVFPAPRPSIDTYWPYMTLNGVTYPLRTTFGGSPEEIAGDYEGLIQSAYKSNGIVWAVELARLMLFMQARFQFRNLRSGRPGEYFGDTSLSILEQPWPNGTTGDLLTRMLQDVDFGGDSFVVKRPNRLRPLRPDWCVLVMGSMADPKASKTDVDADELGLLYFDGGPLSGNEPDVFLSAAANRGVSEYAHFAPIPDPLNPGRGMSWLTPIIREIQSDTAMTIHKGKYFSNGATVNLVISGIEAETQDKFDEWVSKFEAKHKGTVNAYRSLLLRGAAKAEKLGSDFEQADFKVVQGAGEVRICIAGGVPPTVVGVSEGLQGSSLNAGNFASSMRRFADLTMRPLWQNVAGSLEAIVPSPQSNSQLFYDDRDIPALKDDIRDAAEVRNKDAQTIRQLVDAGFDPDAVVAAVIAGDIARLKGQHLGLYSVQLQPPKDKNAPPEPQAPLDGAQPNQEPAQPAGSSVPAPSPRALLAPYLGEQR